jgi:hypothetical protein
MKLTSKLTRKLPARPVAADCLPCLNCASLVCCDLAEGNDAMRAYLCDALGCSEVEAARLTDRMRAADVALVPGDLIRSIRRFADPLGTASAAVQNALDSRGVEA